MSQTFFRTTVCKWLIREVVVFDSHPQALVKYCFLLDAL